MSRILTTLAVSVILIAASSLSAQAPYSISHQGFVTDPDGTPINSTVPMTFKMYKGGAQVWSETHASVQIVDGVYSVLLGATTPFDSLTFDVPIELGIMIDTDAETSPRTVLAATPNALNLRNMRIHRRKGTYGDTANLIGGHESNKDSTDVEFATISGGGTSAEPNRIRGDGDTIGGGSGHLVTGSYGTIGGGQLNRSGGPWSTVSGGVTNSASSDYAVVGGGAGNKSTNAGTTVGGGQGNIASGLYSTVSGGAFNVASGSSSSILGGGGNLAAGQYSAALGLAAHAKHDGSFVWNSHGTGQTLDSLLSTAEYQFLIRAEGGVGIGTNTPDGALHVTKSAIGTTGVSSEDVEQDDLIVEDGDAIVGAYSNDGGTWGSGFVLGELGNLGILTNKWAIVRETTGGGNDLHFRFGTDKEYASNTTQLELTDTGNLIVSGNLSKGGGSFKIDHPLDPKNKYLYHSFVESPDMKNVYDGVAILDPDGSAVIEMPSYFDSLNREYRYQLTCIGGFAPVYVAEEITQNHFRIGGGQPGMKVSWMVTGIRKDPYAEQNRIQVEVDKTGEEKGTYLHPSAHGVTGS